MEKANDEDGLLATTCCGLSETLKKKNILAIRVESNELEELPQFIEDDEQTYPFSRVTDVGVRFFQQVDDDCVVGGRCSSARQ
jgi:hypothetical protein